MTNVNMKTFEANTKDLITQIARFSNQVSVSTDDGDVVILSGDEYRGIAATLQLLNTPGMEEKINKARKEETVKVDWRGDFKKAWK